MKALIIYDSFYGNTELIAKQIGKYLPGLVRVIRLGEVDIEKLKVVDLLIVGSPVHGGRPTPELEAFLMKLPSNCLKGIKVAAFDTRFEPDDHNIGIKILLRIIKYAAERIAKILVKKGGVLIAKPQGFIVNEKRGPLKKGEMEKARQWAIHLSHTV